jgi:hypothetical protein
LIQRIGMMLLGTAGRIALAQSATGAISGIVTDAQGGVYPMPKLRDQYPDQGNHYHQDE